MLKKYFNKYYHIFIAINFLVSWSYLIHAQEDAHSSRYPITQSIDIVSDNVDDLVLKAIHHIKENGEFIRDKNPKPCQQAYNVNYTLLNPLQRIQNLRNPIAKKYLCNELLAFFKGSLNVHQGLAQASRVWREIADEKEEIASNYGYYVFYEKLTNAENMTQYEWVMRHLSHNLHSRKALINISQPHHKKLGIKDYPCTLGIQFFIENNHVCCSVSSRSTDVYWGLPYDMGFFAFLLELVYVDLKQRIGDEKAKDLKLGYVTMKANFTQIYDKTRSQVLTFFQKCEELPKTPYSSDMPAITNAQQVLHDIYNGTCQTEVMQWIYKNAQ